MCADIHDGQGLNAPSKGRIQMSKTNHLQIVTSGLHRTAGPYICAISAHHDRSEGTSLLRAYGQRTSGPFAMLAAISERLSFRLLIAKL